LFGSRKAQFFIISALVIVSVLLLVSTWISPAAVIDTSAVALNNGPYIFDNIVNKANETVAISKAVNGDCSELIFNLQEFKNFALSYAISNGYDLTLTYDNIPQNCNIPPTVKFTNITLIGNNFFANRTFTTTKSFT